MKILGIVPARGGSKGVPGKNIKPFAGEPLIAYTIKIAQASNLIDRLILSTDDEAIANVGRDYGIEIPFLRPQELATDTADAISVFQHALKFVMQENYIPDAVLVLQPTSPLREVKDIVEAIKLMKDKGFDQVISVTKVNQHPYWMKTLQDDNLIKPFMDLAGVSLRRQDLPPLFIPNGAIYLYSREYLMELWDNPKIGAVVMESWRSQDIDYPIDFFMAEKIMEECKKDKTLRKLS